MSNEFIDVAFEYAKYFIGDKLKEMGKLDEALLCFEHELNPEIGSYKKRAKDNLEKIKSYGEDDFKEYFTASIINMAQVPPETVAPKFRNKMASDMPYMFILLVKKATTEREDTEMLYDNAKPNLAAFFGPGAGGAQLNKDIEVLPGMRIAITFENPFAHIQRIYSFNKESGELEQLEEIENSNKFFFPYLN